MTTFIIRRLLLLPLLLVGVTVLIFLMMQLLSPIERAALYVGDFPKNEAAIPALIEVAQAHRTGFTHADNLVVESSNRSMRSRTYDQKGLWRSRERSLAVTISSPRSP